MKKSLLLIATAVAISNASPVTFGLDALVGYDFLSLGSDLGAGLVTGNPESKASLGFAIGPTIAVQIGEMLAIDGTATLLYDVIRYDNSFDLGVLGSNTEEHMLNRIGLGLQVAPAFHITEKFSVKVGYEWDLPLSGTSEVKRTTTIGPVTNSATDKTDIVWAPSKLSDVKSSQTPLLSVHNLILRGSYAIQPNLAIFMQGKMALTGMEPSYQANGDLDGAASSKSNLFAHQLSIGANLGFN